MAQFEKIRSDAQREDVSIRELARRHGVGRATVRQALVCSVPPDRKIPVRRAPKLEPVKVHIDAMLLSDVTAPRKQRHTARRVLARLIDEHGARDITYSAVRGTLKCQQLEALEPSCGRSGNARTSTSAPR